MCVKFCAKIELVLNAVKSVPILWYIFAEIPHSVHTEDQFLYFAVSTQLHKYDRINFTS